MLRFFLLLLPHRALRQLPALQQLTFYERLFTPLVTLWYLLFQWLNHDHSLDAVLSDARAGGADRLNPKLSRTLRSPSTGPYSDARRRLPEQFLAEALRLQGQRITQQSPATLWKEFVLALLDGSTVRLRPHEDIPKEFPPHANQHQNKTYWCLMRVAVSFCALSGAALDCALGSTHLSEQALGCEIILRALGKCLFVGDRNFGVFRIVQAARHAQHQVLVRMTDVRASKLLGGSLRGGDFNVGWQPTGHDQLQPECSTVPVKGRLIIVRLRRRGFRPQWLCLFTTLADQQWHACLLAYNLIRAAMLCAALGRHISPLNLSFSASRRRLESWLRDLGRSRADVLFSWQRTLTEIAHCLLPKRNAARPNEPRAKRYVRESFPPLVGSRTAARKKLRENKL